LDFSLGELDAMDLRTIALRSVLSPARILLAAFEVAKLNGFGQEKFIA
jgi:hypothetical protein